MRIVTGSWIFTGLLLAGCTTYTARVNNAPGAPTFYEDPGTPGKVKGIGIESQDVAGMTDRMARDMLRDPRLAGAATPPHVIVDAKFFTNEGSSRINKNMLCDRLRVLLNRAANGRMTFIGRHYANMVELERGLKRSGTVSPGTRPARDASGGGDYRLGGRISTLDAVDAQNGMASRFHQIVYEMVDLEGGEIVWSGIYDFKKTAQDDVIYR